VQSPTPISDADWEALIEHGGFPEPFLKRDQRFTRRWRTLRQDQLSKQDLREVSRLQDLAAMETLSLILTEQSAQQLVYSNLSREIGTAVDTVRRFTRPAPLWVLGAPMVQKRRQVAPQGAEVVSA
jgi:uncharacterized protein